MHLKTAGVFEGLIDHFTVVCPVTWPLNGSEAAGDLVLIQTSLLLLCNGGKFLKKLWCCVGGSITR